MKIKSRVRRIALAAGGAGVLAGMTIAAPGIASAATATIGTGHVELCSNGNYRSFIQFKNHNGREEDSFVVPQGTCSVFATPSFATFLDVVGVFNTNPSIFFVGSTGASPSTPAKLLRAEGITTAPAFSVTTF
jgi:hypothetical protein